MSDAKIRANFINRDTGEVILDASIINTPATPVTAEQIALDRVNPLSKTQNNKFAPTPSSLSYSTDIFQMADVFDFTIELAPDEDIPIRSHDFVEFNIMVNGNIHQIGVGVLESFAKETTTQQRTIQANGRDLMGQFLTIPFNVQLKHEPLTLRRFVDRMIKGSYLETYRELRYPSQTKIIDKGSFAFQMQFLSDLEQKRGQVLQQYAELAMNLVYMNRLGQVEILGRNGLFGSTAKPQSTNPIGTLQKGVNVERFRVTQNYTNVFSEFTLFYSSGEAIQDRNTLPGSKFSNTDIRVSKHIFQPEYRTFNSADLVTLGGQVKFNNRIRDLAKSLIRKSNRELNSVVAITSEPFFIDERGNEIAYQVGQLWKLKSNEREFTSPTNKDGTDTVDMVITSIHYAQDEGSIQVQLGFNEMDTLL